MKKAFLTTCVAFLFLTATAQENPYIVKTRSAKQKAQVELAADSILNLEDETARDFISENFRFYSLCDWQEGMKFMVMPEKYDLVVKTFADAATGKDVSSMSLRHKIMIYKGHNESSDGHHRVNFYCPDNDRDYYYEIPSGSFDDYCYNKLGVPTLAYLGDVDIAREKLMGRTMYTKTQYYRIDTEYDGDGFMDVTVDKEKEVKVVAVGVGTRAYPVKIIVEDKDGNEFYQNVAISKTNCGMRDDEFIMDNAKYLFGNSFELVDDVMAVNSYNYRAYIGKVVHTKYPTTMLNEATKKVQNIPRMIGFQIMALNPHKNDTKFTAQFKHMILGTYFYKDVTLDQKSITGTSKDFEQEPDDYFSYLFAPGPGRKIETTEGSRGMIRMGHVSVGFSEDEVMLAAGEPDEITHGENGQYTWMFKRSNNKLLYVDFNGSGVVEKYYTKDAPKAKTAGKGRATTAKKKKSSSSSWKNGKGTPL